MKEYIDIAKGIILPFIGLVVVVTLWLSGLSYLSDATYPRIGPYCHALQAMYTVFWFGVVMAYFVHNTPEEER